MMLFPFVKDQEDVIEMVKADYKLTTGKDLPDLFVEYLLESRGETFRKAMLRGDTIKLDKIGKFTITDSKRNYNIVREEFKGKTLTAPGFKLELDKKYKDGELIVRGKKNNDKFKYKFNVVNSKDDE